MGSWQRQRRGAAALGVAVLAIAITTASWRGAHGPQERTDVPPMHHLVVDTDMGVGDALALLYLLQRPDVSVEAVTVEGDGLAHCGAGVYNAQLLLALADRPGVPVACGRAAPIEGARAYPDVRRAAADALGGVELPVVDTPAPAAGSAADLLDRTLTGGVQLVALGPLTNVADALRTHSDLTDRLPGLIVLGGGNGPWVEAGTWIDPVATSEVLSLLPVTLLPLDVADRLPVTPFFLDALGTRRVTPAADLAFRLLSLPASSASGFPEALAAVLTVDPRIAAYTDQDLGVNPAGNISRTPGGGQATRVAELVDPLTFERAFLGALTDATITFGNLRPPPQLRVTFDGALCSVGAAEPLRSGSAVVAFRNLGGDPAVAIVGGDRVRAVPGMESYVDVPVAAGTLNIRCRARDARGEVQSWPATPFDVG
jgi:inosine-uridine nucleoside N-ribohydrolase